MVTSCTTQYREKRRTVIKQTNKRYNAAFQFASLPKSIQHVSWLASRTPCSRISKEKYLIGASLLEMLYRSPDQRERDFSPVVLCVPEHASLELRLCHRKIATSGNLCFSRDKLTYL